MVEPSTPIAETDAPIVFYDGVCGLCNGVVKLLLKADKAQVFQFAPLQGETAERARNDSQEMPRGLDTFVLYDRGSYLVRSRAFSRLAKYLPFPWRVGVVLGWMPRMVGDFFYRIVARIRYRVFGKLEACPLPPQNARARFLP